MHLRSILIACIATNGARAEPVKVACFGDSVTAGSKAKGKPWCRQIRDVLGRAQFLTANFGESGKTVVKYAGSNTAYINSGKYNDWQAENECNDASPYGPYAVGVISLGTNDAKKQNLPSKTTFVAEYKSLITNIVEDLWDVGSDLKQLVLCSAVPIADEPISQTNKGDWNEASKKWVKHLCGN